MRRMIGKRPGGLPLAWAFVGIETSTCSVLPTLRTAGLIRSWLRLIAPFLTPTSERFHKMTTATLVRVLDLHITSPAQEDTSFVADTDYTLEIRSRTFRYSWNSKPTTPFSKHSSTSTIPRP